MSSVMSSPNFIPSTVYGTDEYGESISNSKESGRHKHPEPKNAGNRETGKNDFSSGEEGKYYKS